MDSAVGNESSVLGIFLISEHKIRQFGIEWNVHYQVSEFLSSLPQEKVCLNWVRKSSLSRTKGKCLKWATELKLNIN